MVGLLLLIVVGGLLLWWIIGRTQLREVENVEVNIRERFAFLLTDKMREWDAAGSPVQTCVDRGTRWVLERAPTAAPALGEMVAKAAYIPILRDKIGARLGYERSKMLLDEPPEEPALQAKSNGCTKCGSVNRDGARFCDKCGLPMA